MKIRLLSDLHHEFFEDKNLYKNSANADVLVVAGDLAVGHKACVLALHKFAETHKHVVYTSGNHEYYNGEIDEFDAKLAELVEGSNISFLNPGIKKIEEVTFIGANLWTSFQGDVWAQQAAARGINDFRAIKNFSTSKACELHAEHIKFIKEAYLETAGKRVIVTHFLPAIECVSPRWRAQGNTNINKYFANDEASWIADLTDTPYWLFGHTHDCVDVMIGSTQVIANPYGYNLNKHYKEKILEV